MATSSKCFKPRKMDKLLILVAFLVHDVGAFQLFAQRVKSVLPANLLSNISRQRIQVGVYGQSSQLNLIEKQWQQHVVTFEEPPNKITPQKKYANSQRSNQIDTALLFPGIAPFGKHLSYISPVIDNAITATSAFLLLSHLTIYHAIRWVLQVGGDRMQSVVKQYWWTFPLALCFAPVIVNTIFHQAISTPELWKMVNLQCILKNSPDAAVVIKCFLGSNIAYLGAGLFLLYRFPGDKALKRGLGNWTLCAGLISTIFHTMQAIGDSATAEALCYVDHGVAGAAILYFWKTCGVPPLTFRFWSVTVSGLLALSLPLQPGYAWLHSTWHFLSAYSAVLWAMDGKLKRKQNLLHRVRSVKNLKKNLEESRQTCGDSIDFRCNLSRR